jgi:hypothetical protein
MSPPPQRIGLPWPELNDGLAYKDAISSSESELTTVSEFYFTKYKSSAPLLGFLLFFFLYSSSTIISFLLSILFNHLSFLGGFNESKTDRYKLTVKL